MHPKTGELLVTIGGRGTRGAIYRIAYERGGPANVLPMAKRSLEWNAEEAKQWVKDATDPDALTRRQALEQMLRWREKLGWGGRLRGDETVSALAPVVESDDDDQQGNVEPAGGAEPVPPADSEPAEQDELTVEPVEPDDDDDDE